MPTPAHTTSSPRRRSLSLKTLSAAFIALLAGSEGFAQSRVDAARASAQGTGALPEAPLAAGAEASEGQLMPAMAGDEEFGVQRILYRRSNWEPWNVRFDFGGTYTSNVALVPDGEQDDFFLQSGISVSYNPQIKGGWFGHVSLSDQIYRYDEADFFDFDLLRAEAGLMYAFPRQGTAYDPVFGDLLLYANYVYYAVTEPWEWSERNFDNHSLAFGAVKTWRIAQGNQISFGLNADVSLAANRDEPQRNEYSAIAAYRLKLTSALETALVYRAAWYDYNEFGRDDFNQMVSLGLEYKVTDWFSVNAAVAGIFNNSDREAFDYDVFHTGLSLTASVQW